MTIRASKVSKPSKRAKPKKTSKSKKTENSTENPEAVKVTIGPDFSDVPPLPLKQKIEQLEDYLKDPECAYQTINLNFLIEYYKNGGRPPPTGHTWYILDGSNIVKELPKTTGPPWVIWAEHGFLLETSSSPGPTTRSHTKQVLSQSQALSANTDVFPKRGPLSQFRLTTAIAG